jgi:hypothetical protein
MASGTEFAQASAVSPMTFSGTPTCQPTQRIRQPTQRFICHCHGRSPSVQGAL